jgi:hypothetical protein
MFPNPVGRTVRDSRDGAPINGVTQSYKDPGNHCVATVSWADNTVTLEPSQWLTPVGASITATMAPAAAGPKKEDHPATDGTAADGDTTGTTTLAT